MSIKTLVIWMCYHLMLTATQWYWDYSYSLCWMRKLGHQLLERWPNVTKLEFKARIQAPVRLTSDVTLFLPHHTAW